jgi:hypothetical protein
MLPQRCQVETRGRPARANHDLEAKGACRPNGGGRGGRAKAAQTQLGRAIAIEQSAERGGPHGGAVVALHEKAIVLDEQRVEL